MKKSYCQYGSGINVLIDDFIVKVLSVPFCPYHFVRTILSNTILSVYHFVHTILSVPFCPLPFCPRTNAGHKSSIVFTCLCACSLCFNVCILYVLFRIKELELDMTLSNNNNDLFSFIFVTVDAQKAVSAVKTWPPLRLILLVKHTTPTTTATTHL